MAARPWFLLLCLAAVAAAGGVLQARAQVDSNGFISIDCGLPGPASIVDVTTKLSYSPDTSFTNAGSNHDISVEYTYSKLIKLYYNVRSFPDGVRNCYTLRSLVPGIKYLIRAYFLYGNYDGLNRLPIFDIYIGENPWATVNVSTTDNTKIWEAIVVVPDDSVSVCLVNTGTGIPFISGLDLRPLKSELYPQVNVTQGMVLENRFNFGLIDASQYVRYPEDIHDRIWVSLVDRVEFDKITTITKVQSLSVDFFEPPMAVMQTAVTPRNISENEIGLVWSSKPRLNNPSPGYFVVLHFAELRLLRGTSVRQFYIRFNGELLYPEAYTPGYQVNSAIYNTVPVRNREFKISIEALSTSTLKPILNAMEIFTVVSTTKAYITGGADTPSGADIPGEPDTPGKLVKRKSSLAMYIAIPVVVMVVIAVVAVIFCFIRGKKQRSMNNSVKPQNEMTTSSASGIDIYRANSLRLENRRFTYEELKMITNNFQKVLGQGGFGKVYNGFLEDGTQVAVKLRSHSSSQGDREFLAETQILSRIHHKNLVSMIGYCKDGEYMALVYEYMSEGTLQEHIEGTQYHGGCLPWKQRLRIALESAQGLEYLHKGCDPPLIHRDVKATNILLNTRMQARIADFGLSKAFNWDSDHVSTNTVVGTPGYLDPEYHATMQLTAKSDVYSFGVVLLELVTGKPAILQEAVPTGIIKWARQRMARGNIESVVDARMGGIYDVNSVWKVVEIALKCTEYAPPQRPTMSNVVVQLQECIELEEGHAVEDGNEGVYSSGGTDNPNLSYDYDASISDQSSNMNQSNTSLQMVHNANRVAAMPTGPAAR